LPKYNASQNYTLITHTLTTKIPENTYHCILCLYWTILSFLFAKLVVAG